MYEREVEMAEFEDLTPYSYGETPQSGRALNVGWIGRSAAFTRGDVASGVLRRLIELAASPAAVERGLHYCELCDVDSPVRIDTSLSPKGRVSLGTGEIRVLSDDGAATYCAPTLIVHYILDHGYCPPDDFVQAVQGRRSDGASGACETEASPPAPPNGEGLCR
jgi:hypothetical protein